MSTENLTQVSAENQDTRDTAERGTAAFEADLESPLTVSVSPHIHSGITTRSIMIDVIIALLPSVIWGIYIFGFRALTIVTVSILSCVLFEGLYRLLLKKNCTLSNCSAIVTGLLIGMNMPATVPLWLPIVGSFFAIVIVKELFGGIGKNFMNPALAARVFLMLAWPSFMSATPSPFTTSSAFALSIESADITAQATAMQLLKSGTIPETGLFNLLLGAKPGTIGEVSSLLLIAGGVYLLVRRVITWHIPVAYLGTVALISYFFPRTSNVFRTEFVICELICGGLLLAAIYMATDYTTSPVTASGRLIFGVGCGLITMFVRYFGTYPEGISFAILIMNSLVWYIDQWTKPKRFGTLHQSGT